MKNYGRIAVSAGVGIVLGLALAACDGRVGPVWFAIETAAMIYLTALYFLACGEKGNWFQSLLICVVGAFMPVLLWRIIVRSNSYFGYTGTKIMGGALVCGLVIFGCCCLVRHQTGPLRAAFGRNLLPAFFGVAAAIRLIKYFGDIGSFTVSFKDSLCVHGLFFALFALGVFIGANRSLLSKLESWIAAALWTGVFVLCHILSFIDLPVLEV